MARAHGARAQMALAFETVYGTPHGSGYQLLPVTAHQRPVGRETGEMPLTINEGIAWRLTSISIRNGSVAHSSSFVATDLKDEYFVATAASAGPSLLQLAGTKSGA